ncbi:MAG: transcriptional repressor [Candidatus Krumholzibacteriota bacterium]|nr:transcriptional repressor [Candidatus Krumholzibacteriota bacterium]
MERANWSRRTRQREMILREIKKLRTHPSAADIYEIVRKKLPRISLGTVYRNLEDLSRAGIIRKIRDGGTRARYDGTAAGHYHLHCQRCGRLVDLEKDPSPPVRVGPGKMDGWEITGYRLEFTGICPSCLKKKV